MPKFLRSLFLVALSLCIGFQPSFSPKQSDSFYLSPVTQVPRIAQFESLEDLFLPLLNQEIDVSDSFYAQLLQSRRLRSALDITEGEEKTRDLIRLALQTKKVPFDNFYLAFLDINNLKLRNWTYTNEIMDVVLADFDNALMRIAQRSHRQINNQTVHGFSYVQGGDERILVLPTDDPKEIEKVLVQIQTYLRRLLKGKYHLGVLQLDGDSRIVTRGKENPKNDEERKLLFEGEYFQDEVVNNNPGILHLLEQRGVKWVRHSEQYYLIYEDEDALDEIFFEIQQVYPDHFVDFKPHAYYGGVLDTPTLTGVASSLKETLKDMNGSVKKTPANILDQWALRNEIASQYLADQGKDAVALLRPDAYPLRSNRYRNEGKLRVLNNEEWIDRQAQKRSGNLVFGQYDGRFARMPKKKVAIQNTIAAIKNPGYLVQVDIGYLNDAIKQKVIILEEEYKAMVLGEDPSLNPDDEEDLKVIRKRIRDEWFKEFRVISPHILGVNTKFLNDAITHGGTDDMISAILTYVWQGVHELDETQWESPVFVFRGPPDSIYLWFPVEQGNGIEESGKIEKLRQDVEIIFNQVRENIYAATDVREREGDGEVLPGQIDTRIKLNFLISVLAVQDTEKAKLIPRGSERKAGKLFENMERAYRVLMESVIKQNADKLEKIWRERGGAARNTRPQTLKKIQEQLISEFQEEIEGIDSEHSHVNFRDLGSDKFLTEGTFFLVYNGNIEAKSEKIQIELAVSSEVEISRRELTDKAEKWKREIALGKLKGEVNYNELLYILNSMIQREKELTRFNDEAARLGVKREIDETLGFTSKDTSVLKEMAQLIDTVISSGQTPEKLTFLQGKDILERITSREIYDPKKIYSKLEVERQRLAEQLFHLTGIFLDRREGARIPKKGEEIVIHYAYEDFDIQKDDLIVADGKSKIKEVLASPASRAKWKQLRQEYRQLLQFTRYQPLFERFVTVYQELLDTLPRADQLLKDLYHDEPAIFAQLSRMVFKENLTQQGYVMLASSNGSPNGVIHLRSITYQNLLEVQNRIKPLVSEKELVGLTQRQPDSLLESAI